MKVSIRREEIKAVLSAYFQMEVDDFIISVDEPSLVGKVVRSVVINPLVPGLRMANIKALRALAIDLKNPLGLQDAAWSTQHWLEFIAFVDEYNRLPLAGYGTGKDIGKLI